MHARSRGNFDREPNPVEEKQGEKDCNGEAEVVLQKLWVPDIGDQGEEHADGGKQPGEPAFAENGCIGVLDLEGRE